MAVPRRVRELFERELSSRGLPIEEATDDGVYTIKTEAGSNNVSLENVAREFAGHADEGRLTARLAGLIDSLLASTGLVPESWDEARPRIRLAVESAEIDMGDAMLDPLSDQVRVGPVYVSPGESQIAYLPPSFLETWGQTRESLMRTARENTDELIRQLDIHVEEVDGHRLGMFAMPDDFPASAFKAAFLVSPTLKEIVEPVLGWPVFAVMPNRDFVYIIPHEDQALLPRLGPTVVREFHQSAYSISTEVFEINDDGPHAIAEFQAPDGADPVDSADGMKTIAYRGGVVTFRIPSHWEEEYGDEGGGTFYDEDAEGTLRLSVMTFKSAKRVTDGSPTEMLELRSEKVGGEVVTLPDGNAYLHYRQDAEDEDGEELAIWYWEVASIVPPEHARIALFSFTVAAELAEDAEVEATLAMLREEIPGCEFAEELGE